ncbi:MAG: MogA/MoaB family molybdenum cofactor biosynthesis protein [Pirellulaceae bacterium]
MNPSVPDQHRESSAAQVPCAVITVSDTRTRETDVGGKKIVELLSEHQHMVVERVLLPDEPTPIRTTVMEFANRRDIHAILLTGGTGISSRDQTCETISQLLDKPLPGYGELFRLLSYQEIGAAAMLSRATGGVVSQTVLLTMPGSPAAVELAMQKLILPELAHLVAQARK